MSYDLQNLPPALQNKPEEQKVAFLTAYEAAIQKGRNSTEAEFAGMSAVKLLVRKNFSTRDKTFKKPPSHVPTLDVIKAIKEEEPVRKALLLPAFLQKHSLPEGVSRNVIAANFDTKGKLVIAFDTGETITTDALSVQEIIEQHISVNMRGGSGGTGGGGTAPAGNLLYNEYALSGTHFFLHKEEHGLEFITSFYIKDKHHKEVILEVHINHTGRIDIHSLIPMTDMTLHLTGITL